MKRTLICHQDSIVATTYLVDGVQAPEDLSDVEISRLGRLIHDYYGGYASRGDALKALNRFPSEFRDRLNHHCKFLRFNATTQEDLLWS